MNNQPPHQPNVLKYDFKDRCTWLLHREYKQHSNSECANYIYFLRDLIKNLKIQ